MTTRSPRRGGAIGWIAGSLAERDEALALLQDAGAAEPRDELGIGPLRDVLANAFFPGITTLQTRAKYFLFVPAMYARVEADSVMRRRPREAILELENTLLHRLLSSKDDLDGVIGSRFRRVPETPSSAIYWSGLQTWRIRRFMDSRARYHGYLQTPSRLLIHEHEEDGPETEEPVRWLEVPGGEGLLDDPDIGLNRQQSDFLESCILATKDRGSPLRRTVGHDRTPSRRPLLRELLHESLRPDQSFWDLAVVRDQQADLSLEARDAEWLSAAMYGGMLLYNRLCAGVRRDTDAVEHWSSECDMWSAAHPPAHWVGWDLDAFWVRVSQLRGGVAAMASTRAFIDAWVAVLRSLDSTGLAGSSAARRELERRERRTKPGRERLTSQCAIAGWTPEGVGREALDFRWRRARRILLDIQEGAQR